MNRKESLEMRGVRQNLAGHGRDDVRNLEIEVALGRNTRGTRDRRAGAEQRDE